MERAIRSSPTVAFYLGILVLLALTLMPSNIIPALPHDKLQHFASFLALGILGFGWVSTRSAMMFVALAALGAAIELLQPLPLFGRDGDIFDWVADLAGIATAFAIVTVAHEFSRRSKVPN